jgi:hypothetical protein
MVERLIAYVPYYLICACLIPVTDEDDRGITLWEAMVDVGRTCTVLGLRVELATLRILLLSM